LAEITRMTLAAVNPERMIAEPKKLPVHEPAAHDPYHYVGSELELFAKARHWKAYLKRQIAPQLGSRVLEVGAGIGGTTRALFDPAVRNWLALEPDAALAACYNQARQQGALPACCDVRVGTTQRLNGGERFDCVLYIDVLEHIENDQDELAQAACLLAPQGRLVVLAPAHPFLFSPFDQAVGHFRRYNRRMLRSLAPPGCRLVRLIYLDSVGLLASLGNRLFLRRANPSPRQIAFWDQVLVRASRLVDPILGHRLGKSILAVWQKNAV